MRRLFLMMSLVILRPHAQQLSDWEKEVKQAALFFSISSTIYLLRCVEMMRGEAHKYAK
jgi:hypothetical protein